MSRPNIDINATVKKLQASCEEKIMKLDQLHQAIAQKEAQLKGISNQSKENLILSELINESASLQLQLANLMVQIEEENEISQQNAQVMYVIVLPFFINSSCEV
jgi:tetrahydrodipicolinate N-succinyltransferase